jgi:hypothetical protein
MRLDRKHAPVRYPSGDKTSAERANGTKKEPRDQHSHCERLGDFDFGIAWPRHAQCVIADIGDEKPHNHTTDNSTDLFQYVWLRLTRTEA